MTAAKDALMAATKELLYAADDFLTGLDKPLDVELNEARTRLLSAIAATSEALGEKQPCAQ